MKRSARTLLTLAAFGCGVLALGSAWADDSAPAGPTPVQPQPQVQPAPQEQAATPVAAPAGASPTAVPEAVSGTSKPKHHPRPKPTEAESPEDTSLQLAPDFTLTDVSTGKPFSLSSHRGKVVLIDFWATWCGPCRMAIPHLIELQREYRHKGLQVVGVSLDQQGPAVVKPFYQQWKMNYAVVVDDTGTVARDYGGIRSIPTALLLDKHGRVLTGFVGYRPKEEYEAAIKAALAKS
jgi:thiol-disulfide isomerase/thioredoxin